MAQQTIVLAGAAGDLGIRIAKALIGRGAAVRALVRNEVSTSDRDRLSAMGVTVATADVADAGSVAVACQGAACVVSALNGLHEVIIDRQGVLLDVAVKSGVPRFVSSDYSADFTTKDDVAAYTAAAALDAAAPRILRIAGDTVSARGIAHTNGTTRWPFHRAGPPGRTKCRRAPVQSRSSLA